MLLLYHVTLYKPPDVVPTRFQPYGTEQPKASPVWISAARSCHTMQGETEQRNRFRVAIIGGGPVSRHTTYYCLTTPLRSGRANL
jgi:hypothetical protein